MAFLFPALSTAEPSEQISALFALEAPRIAKADWVSEKLAVGDFDGDAKIDLATINNQKGVLQMFLRKEDGGAKEDALAGAVFYKHEEVLSDSIAALCVGDFDGDGRDDLALAPRDRNVLVRLQTKEGLLAPAATIEARGFDLRSDDLDGDGIADLTVFSPLRIDIFYGSKSDSMPTLKPASLFNGVAPGSPLAVGDFDGDGNADLLYRDANRRHRVTIRFQTAPRRWSLESAFEIVESVDDLASVSGPSGQSRLAAIDSRTREVRVFELQPAPKTGKQLALDGPYFLASGSEARVEKAFVLAADANGDKRLDILAASPENAEIGLWAQSESQGMDFRPSPALSDIVSLAAIAAKQGSLIFSLSGREQTIGVSVWDPDRGLTVPRLLDVGNKPLAMAAADLDGSGKADLIYIYNEPAQAASAGQSATLRLAVFADPSSPGLFDAEPVLWPLPPELKMEEPDGLQAADINGDGRCDLMIFSKYAPLVLLVQEKDRSFVSLAADKGIKKGIFDNVRPGHVCIDDIDDDRKAEILVARQNFARAYRIDERGDATMVEQFNGRGAASRIESVVVADLDGSGRREVVLLDTGGAAPALTIYERGDSKVYRLARHQDIEGVRGSSLAAGDFGAGPADDLLVYGGERMHLFYSGRAQRAMKPVWKRAPEDRDGKYARIFALRLLDSNAHPCAQILALEAVEHILDFLLDSREAPSGAPPALSAGTRFFEFKVFDDDASAAGLRDPRGPAQPREIVAADVDGDGLQDLIALAHDNILYYRQVGPKEKGKKGSSPEPTGQDDARP